MNIMRCQFWYIVGVVSHISIFIQWWDCFMSWEPSWANLHLHWKFSVRDIILLIIQMKAWMIITDLFQDMVCHGRPFVSLPNLSSVKIISPLFHKLSMLISAMCAPNRAYCNLTNSWFSNWEWDDPYNHFPSTQPPIPCKLLKFLINGNVEYW